MMTSCADPTFSYPSRDHCFYAGSVNSELGIFTGQYPDSVDDVIMDPNYNPDLSFIVSMEQFYEDFDDQHFSRDDLSSCDSDNVVGGNSDGNISDDNSLTDAVMDMLHCTVQPPLHCSPKGPPPSYEASQNKSTNMIVKHEPYHPTKTNTSGTFIYSQTKMPESISNDNKTVVNKINTNIKIKQEYFPPETETNEDRKGRPPHRSCISRYSADNLDSKPNKKIHKPRVKKTIHLWEFLEEIVDNKAYSPKYITWVSREDGVFRLVDSKAVAKLWGQRKNRHDMTYEKMSRAIRYYYERDIIRHVMGQKLIYQFGDEINEKRRLKDKMPSKVSNSIEEKHQVCS